MTTTTATPSTLSSLPTEVLEHIVFYYLCPRVLGPPIPLTALLLLCKAITYKLSVARHLYARVFKHKFSFSAIRRRGFEPRAGEWAWQLRWWCEVLKGVRSRRRRSGSEAYMDDYDAEEAGVQETMYALWIMCLEDDGCNRVQMQLAGVYEWVEGYIRTEMYKTVDKGWPLANAGNSCAMWVFWYLSSKARLMDESTEQIESLIVRILPFLTVPFRYPSSFAPANHFRLPLPSFASFSSSTPFSIPTPHGPFPIYLHPSRHTWLTPHFERWTPLCTPLAADAAKLVYFSRRETMLFSVFDLLPRNREDHRARIPSIAAAMNEEEEDYNDEEDGKEMASKYNDDDSSHREVDLAVDEETDEQEQFDQADNDMQRNRTMLTGYPQKGAVYTPGSLNGLWTGRMMVTINEQDFLLPAGHRPNPFTEGTLGLFAVPLYVRLSEYVMYSDGNPVPCANDTEDGNDDSLSASPSSSSLSSSAPVTNLTLTRKIGSEAEARSKRKPGTFHDRETCPGCVARERALLAARNGARVAESSSEEPTSSTGRSSQEEPTEDLPPYVPSEQTIPSCNGIRDVLITGSTDPRHAEAWGNWVWRGRVRKWDGLVGLVRSADSGVGTNFCKIFFYGTLLGGRNLVGTWRQANEDPRMPSYEGAFTLGRKEE
ncbi:hypothetical protein J3R30DRAFT_3286192 [Lentinula aciculospora]|uniref:F-box domain-containing protein n=1 Tax=Lentinula aciculospora TaxID=153920 RepID=A0A9W9DQX4_9AGAR|nr:hypothetical protein J3R30DRAFT_3286192 [Lentinula aciculospora]